MAKPIKFLGPSGSPIIPVFLTPAPIHNSKGTPSTGAKYTGVGKLLQFSTEIAVYLERYEIGPWLLWNVNRKS